jgi:HK97 family phage major capsid protein
VEIPRKTATSTAYWVGEGSDITESTPTFDQLTLTPKTLGALTSWSRKLTLQGSPDIEMLMRNDLATKLAVELDRVAIEGSGSGAEPEGILNTTGIGAIALGTNGDYPAYADLVNLVKEVAADNADIGKLGFMLSATAKAKLQLTEKATDTGLFVFEDGENGDGRIAGYRALVSNQVPDDLDKGTSEGICSAVIFGDFSSCIIGNWGSLELALDNTTNFASAGLRLRAILDADIGIRHAPSFAAIQDMLTA